MELWWQIAQFESMVKHVNLMQMVLILMVVVDSNYTDSFLDAPLDPRNIARELVNRFVGQNYELR